MYFFQTITRAGISALARIRKLGFYGGALTLAATFAAQSALAQYLGPGGLSVGGPGTFEGVSGDVQVVHDSGSPRTLCLTLATSKGTTRAYFDGRPDFDVGEPDTRSACMDSVSEVSVGCEGDKCTADWRVDTVSGGTDISESTCDADQYASGIDATGSVVCSSLSSYVNSNCAIYFGWRDNVNGATTAPNKVGRVRGDGDCTVQGFDSNCTEYTDILTDTVTLVGINTDGDVDGTDKFYIGMKCSGPSQEPEE